MGYDRSEILLIAITLCVVIGGSVFAAMVVGAEYGVLEIPYGPYILLILAVIIVILVGLLVVTGIPEDEKQAGWF